MKPRLLFILSVSAAIGLTGCATERGNAAAPGATQGAGTSGAQGSDHRERPEIVTPDPNSGVVDPAPPHGSRGLDNPSPDTDLPGQPGPMTI